MDETKGPGPEQRVDVGIDFAAQCAKMFGFGAAAEAAEPLAMMGVHLGFGIAHIITAFHRAQKAARQGPPAPTPAQPAGQPVAPGEPSQ